MATKLALMEGPAEIVYCYVREEHPDNIRFKNDCEKWFGQEIKVISNEKYNGSIYEVFEKRNYLVGVAGAPCTRLLKKEIRKNYELPSDRQVFGYTIEEQDRVDRFIDANNNVNLWSILIEKNLTKEDCLAILQRANIELPAMYKLGYKNNNCIGCVKGGLGYWNKIKVDFPKEFERMAQMERKINAKILKHKGNRIWLTDLPKDAGDYPAEQAVECGIFCHMAESAIND